jgi:hypothetical protein
VSIIGRRVLGKRQGPTALARTRKAPGSGLVGATLWLPNGADARLLMTAAMAGA